MEFTAHFAWILQQSGKTLVDTAQLSTSITYEATASGVEVGTNKIYGPIQHFGGETGKNKARKMLTLPFLVILDGKSCGDPVYFREFPSSTGILTRYLQTALINANSISESIASNSTIYQSIRSRFVTLQPVGSML